MGDELRAAAAAAKEASRRLAFLETEVKNAVLMDLADAVVARSAEILRANAEDMERSNADGLADAKLKRLALDEKKIASMAEGVRQIAGLDDPVGKVSRGWETADGLKVEKVRTPLGVIAMIYEARPNVTIDAFALCFKAGNACLLKGGREANASNTLLASICREVLEKHGVPGAAMTAVTTSDRDEIKGMLQLEGLIDLVIPRGGEGLIRFVHEHSRIPTVQHFHGVCHAYVDAAADLEKALEIVLTGKTSAPATCNALECVLVHRDVVVPFAGMLAMGACSSGTTSVGFDGRVSADDIDPAFKIRADVEFSESARDIESVIANYSPFRANLDKASPDQRVAITRSMEAAPEAVIELASDDDWGREYLDLVLAAKVVDSMDDAIAHIARYGSDHTDVIVTEDSASADRFCREVTSSCVLVNASTRFNDGFSLGLGAEIGISTSKIHAYGPMGLEELTAERYVVRGDGQTR